MSDSEGAAASPSGSDHAPAATAAPQLLAPAALPTKAGAGAGGLALDKRKLAALDARRKKKGVVYMSRVPPNMV
jgi:hypothetical protein